MTTFKKLAFCSTCAAVLLGTTPKVLAEQTLKDEVKKEKQKKEIPQDSKLKDSIAGSVHLFTTVFKATAGLGVAWFGLRVLETQLFSKTSAYRHLASTIFGGSILVAAGIGGLAWGLKDIYNPFFQKADEEN